MFNSNLLSWRNILFIAVVAIVAHHFGKRWMKTAVDAAV